MCLFNKIIEIIKTIIALGTFLVLLAGLVRGVPDYVEEQRLQSIVRDLHILQRIDELPSEYAGQSDDHEPEPKAPGQDATG